MIDLTLEAARTVVDTALREARNRNLKPLAVVVYDARGALKAVAVEDGTSLRRAEIDKWAEWAKINITLNFTGLVFWRVVRTAPSMQDPAVIGAALDALTRFLCIAEARLEQQTFLGGKDFTLADIQFGHVLYRYFDIDIARPDLPHIARYYAGLVERPAFAEHVMVPYDALRVTD